MIAALGAPPDIARTTMEVLLLEDVERLGKKGDVVKVAPGYARNYLLPRKLAVLSTPENLRAIEAERRRAEKREAERRAALRDLAARLEGTSVTIAARAGEGGHLFGSVGAAQIAAAFQAEGYEVSEDMVHLEAPFRELGVYSVELRLAAEINCTTRVWVVAE